MSLPQKSNEDTVILELEKIQIQYRIDEERFLKGYSFAMAILDGEAASFAYAEAFNVPFAQAKTLSSQLYRTKWIQAIIKECEVDTELRDRESLEDVKTAMATIMEDSPETSDKIAAARVLKDTIVSQKKEKKEDIEQIDDRVQKILIGLKEASQKGMIVTGNSDLIETTVIE